MEIQAYRTTDKWSYVFYWVGAIAILSKGIYEPLLYIGFASLAIGILLPVRSYLLSRSRDEYRDHFTITVNDCSLCDGQSRTVHLSEIINIVYENEVLQVITGSDKFTYRLLPGQLEKVVLLKQQVKDALLLTPSFKQLGFDIRYSGVKMVLRIDSPQRVKLSRLEKAMENILSLVVIKECQLVCGDSEVVFTDNIVQEVQSYLRGDSSDVPAGAVS